MASQGPLFPGTTANLSNAGTSESAEAWVNPGNVVSDNGTEAQITAATYDSPDISQILVASNFNFNQVSGTVNGITVEIDRRSIIASSGKDFRVQLAKGTTFASLVGNNKAVPATIWPTTSTVATYGSTSDLWGASWSASDITASSFAVFVSCQANIANADVGIDFIRVTVEYTPPVNTTVTPSTASLTTATFAPTVSTTSNIRVTPSTASLTTAVFVPTIRLPKLATPVTASLKLSTYETLLPDGIVSQAGFSGATLAEFTSEDGDTGDATSTSAAIRLSFPTPTVTPTSGGFSRLEALIKAVGSNTTAAVDYHQSGSLVIGSGNVIVTAGTSAVVGVNIPNASLTDLAGGQARISLNVIGSGVDVVYWRINAGYAPVIGTGLTPTTSSLSLTTFAPTVTVEAQDITVTPSTASLSTSTFAPTIRLPQLVTPATASLTTLRFSAVVSTPRTVTPLTLALNTGTFAPTINIGVNVSPTTASLVSVTFAPTVTATQHQRVTPTTLNLISATFAPTVTATDPKLVTPGLVALTITTFAPSVGSFLALPRGAVLSLSVPATHRAAVTMQPETDGTLVVPEQSTAEVA